MNSPAEWCAAWKHPAALAGYLTEGRFHRPAHVEFMSQRIAEACLRGGGRFLITMPPRHGKSTLCSSWLPFWFLNLFPDRDVMLVSYGATFAEKWGRRVRRLCAVYGSQTMMELAPDSRSASEWETTEAGGMKSLGIGGDATGRGAHLLLIDDPIKNSEEARSELIREKTWEFWQETLRTRLEPGGTTVIIQTRWHEDDLCGRLLASDEAGDHWTRINFPAIAEEDDVLGRREGEPLWPERYPLEELVALRDSPDGVGSRAFAALYQQRPSPAGGSMFKSEHFRYYERDGEHVVFRYPDRPAEDVHISRFYLVQVADTAMTVKTSSDYTVVTTLAVHKKTRDILVWDVARKRLEVPDQWNYVQSQVAKHWGGEYRWIGCENKGSGIGLIQQSKREGQRIRELDAVVDKETRAVPAAVAYEQGKVWHPKYAPWLADFEHELLSFPNGTHDDQVDTIAYGVREIDTRSPRPVSRRVPERPDRDPFDGYALAASSRGRDRINIDRGSREPVPASDLFDGYAVEGHL